MIKIVKLVRSLNYPLLLAALLFSANSSAQIKLFVDARSEDTVGRRLINMFKERIQQNPGIFLADKPGEGRLIAIINTIDPDKTGSPGKRTVYSVSWSVQSIAPIPVILFLMSSVAICGDTRLSECVDALVDDANSNASFVISQLQEIIDKDKKR